MSGGSPDQSETESINSTEEYVYQKTLEKFCTNYDNRTRPIDPKTGKRAPYEYDVIEKVVKIRRKKKPKIPESGKKKGKNLS